MTSPTATGLLADWVTSLREDDRSTHTIRAYAGAIQRFFAWYEREEGRPPTLADLTPVALTGYRHDLQHRQKQATRSVNSAVAAIRAFCRWLTEQGHLPTNPAARLKAIGQRVPPAPQGLSDREVHAFLRAAAAPGIPRVITPWSSSSSRRACASASAPLWTTRISSSASVAAVSSCAAARGTRPAPSPSMPPLARRWSLMPRRPGGRRPHSPPSLPLGPAGNAASAAHRLVPGVTSAHTLRHTFAWFYVREQPGDLIWLATLRELRRHPRKDLSAGAEDTSGDYPHLGGKGSQGSV